MSEPKSVSWLRVWLRDIERIFKIENVEIQIFDVVKGDKATSTFDIWHKNKDGSLAMVQFPVICSHDKWSVNLLEPEIISGLSVFATRRLCDKIIGSHTTYKKLVFGNKAFEKYKKTLPVKIDYYTT